MASLINRTIGTNKGTPRIYLDDALLEQLNIEDHGQQCERVWLEDKLIIRLCENGKYKLSSKKKNGRQVPVLDIQTLKLSELFDESQKLRIAIKSGVIVIQAHVQEKRIKEREERFINSLNTGEALSFGSCFHGGGVMDRALHEGINDAGVTVDTSFVIEIDERYLNSSIKNNQYMFNNKTAFICSDVADVQLNNIPQVSILAGGIPCTGASSAGKAKNKISLAEEHETAGACFFHFLSIVKACNPAICIIENVKNYLTTASFCVIKSVLGSLGYNLYTNVFNGHDYGSFEKRERMVCIAVSKGLDVSILDSFDSSMNRFKKKPALFSDILESVHNESELWKEVTYLKEKQTRDIANGKGFRMQILEHNAESCGVVGAGYAKARSTEPRVAHPINSELSRLFTPIEHARVKGIPEGLVDGLSATVAHQILGNSVIYPLFNAIGFTIANLLKCDFSRTELFKAA